MLPVAGLAIMLLLPLLLLFGAAAFQGTACNPFAPAGDYWELHYAVRALASQSLRETGLFPSWDPRCFGGDPVLGELSTQFFYPPSLAYGLATPVNNGVVYFWLSVAHFAFGCIGTYLWLRQLGFAFRPSLAGAWFFVLSAKWHAHIWLGQHPMQGLAWLPWVCMSIQRIESRGRAEIPRLAVLLYFLVASLTCQTVRDATYFLIGLGVFTVVRSRRPKRQLLHLLAAGLLAAAMSCFYLLPAFEYLSQCTRSQGLTVEQAARGTWPLETLPARLLMPIPPQSIGWEATLYLGVVSAFLMGLAFSGLKSARAPQSGFGWRDFAWMLPILFIFVMGSNNPTFPLLMKFLPAFSLFRYPERFAMLTGWLGAPLVARGMEVLLESSNAQIRKRALILLLPMVPAAWVGIKAGWTGQTVLMLGLFSLALALSQLPKPWRQQAFLGMIACELFVMPASMLDLRPIEQVYGTNALGAWLQTQPDHGRIWLVNSHQLGSAYTVFYDLEVNQGINGYVPWVSYRYAQQGVAGQPLHYTLSASIPADLPIASVDFLSRGHYGYVATLQPLQVPGLELQTTLPPYPTFDFVAPGGFMMIPTTYVYKNTANLPRARLVSSAVAARDWDDAFTQARLQKPDQKVVLETDQPLSDYAWEAERQEVKLRMPDSDHRRITCSVPAGKGGAYLVVSEMYYLGWQAREAGRELPVIRADGAFCCIPLGEGQHEIELFFQPASFPKGLAISLMALAVTVLLWFSSRRGGQE
ncbi:hypothetical protein JST97_15050 [bacterium]|nr:hypothetical protein [bacterium]